jgi:hypothetical protein
MYLFARAPFHARSALRALLLCAPFCSAHAADPGGEEHAHLMSMPSRANGKDFPLFHYTGHVPRASIVSTLAPNFDL